MSHSLVKKDVGQIDVSKAVEHEVMHGDLFKLNRKGQWQKRWFRLTDEHLSYYTNAKATTPKATIDLKDCHGIEKLRNGVISISMGKKRAKFSLTLSSYAK